MQDPLEISICSINNIILRSAQANLRGLPKSLLTLLTCRSKLYLLEEEEKKQQKILRALQDILDQDHEKNVAAKLFAQKCEVTLPSLHTDTLSIVASK